MLGIRGSSFVRLMAATWLRPKTALRSLYHSLGSSICSCIAFFLTLPCVFVLLGSDGPTQSAAQWNFRRNNGHGAKRSILFRRPVCVLRLVARNLANIALPFVAGDRFYAYQRANAMIERPLPCRLPHCGHCCGANR